MSLSTRIAPHLPDLRRFSRAVTGSQTSGDAYVAATLEALIADLSIFPNASNDRIAVLAKMLFRFINAAPYLFAWLRHSPSRRMRSSAKAISLLRSWKAG